MRHSTTLLAAAVAATLLAPTAGAQNCVGLPTFTAGPVRLDAGLSTGNDATSFSAGLSFGAPRGPFGSISVERVDLDRVDESATGFGVQGGWDIDLSRNAPRSAARFSLCPLVGFHHIGWSDEPDVDLSTNTVTAGVALGAPLAATPTLAVVPFGSLSWAHASTKFEVGNASDTSSDDYGVVDLGVGLVLNRVFTIRPLVSIPVGLDGADASFGVSLHFNFGGR